MSPEEILEKVHDRESFISFVEALAAEREMAEQTERGQPIRFGLGGSFNWQNADISSFLYAALNYFTPNPLHQPVEEPGWKMFAEFLYCGKIIE
jgi:hypothetical protein